MIFLNLILEFSFKQRVFMIFFRIYKNKTDNSVLDFLLTNTFTLSNKKERNTLSCHYASNNIKYFLEQTIYIFVIKIA